MKKISYLLGMLAVVVVLLTIVYYLGFKAEEQSVPEAEQQPSIIEPTNPADGVETIIVEEPAAEEAVPADEAALPEEVSGVAEVLIEINFFNPAELKVPVGTTVRWVNDDTKPHKIVAYDRTFYGERMQPGDIYEFTFTKSGTYAYFDAVFPKTYRGTIIVE